MIIDGVYKHVKGTVESLRDKVDKIKEFCEVNLVDVDRKIDKQGHEIRDNTERIFKVNAKTNITVGRLNVLENEGYKEASDE